MLIFWLLVFLSGILQLAAAVYGQFYCDVNVKFVFLWTCYALMNSVTGWLGIIGK